LQCRAQANIKLDASARTRAGPYPQTTRLDILRLAIKEQQFPAGSALFKLAGELSQQIANS
jgi:formate hydrogenlyase subunit 4